MARIYKIKNMERFNIRKEALISFLLLIAVSVVGQTNKTNAAISDVPNSSEEALDSTKSYEIGLQPTPLETIQGLQYDSSFVSNKLRKKDQKLTVFGYYRLFLYGRNMTEPYPNLKPYEKAYGVGDGYREPMLSMTVVGRPNGRSSFGTELFIFTPYLGTYTEGNTFTMNLGINFYGNFRTKHGNFGVRAGGIHWYNLSPFTIGVFQILDRFSIFDRTPWEGVNNDVKYNSYFKTGATSPGDLRWNNQAFQGLILNGFKLPGEFAFDIFWGKTQQNGGLPNAIDDPLLTSGSEIDAGYVPTYFGFNGDARNINNFITGGKIGRSFGNKGNSIFYNIIHSQTAIDSLRKDSRSYQVHTLSLNLNIGDVIVNGELGAGNYKSPTYEEKWGEALMLNFLVPEKYTFLPLGIQVYQISKNYYNQNGEISTNNNPEIVNDLGVPIGLSSFGGQISVVNQLVHNRRGININTGYEIGPAKFSIGWGLASEMDATSSVITYNHRINGLALSRIYNPFPAGATGPTIFGPYGRKFSFFRGVNGVVQTTDLDPETAQPTTKKSYNAVDLQAKLKFKAGDRSLFFFYLGSFGSAKSKAALIPTLNDDTYLFVQYHELDAYYEIFPKFMLTGYVGIENAKGGRFTQWDTETLLPLDQFGTGLGLGFDWLINESTGIYFRHRWMNFEDRSFSLDKYKGREVTIELKTFF